MTCDGKVMVVTEHDAGAIGLAGGAMDEEDFEIMGFGDIAVVWLAMTDTTLYRWENGHDEPSDTELGYPDLEAIHEAQRERWYA